MEEKVIDYNLKYIVSSLMGIVAAFGAGYSLNGGNNIVLFYCLGCLAMGLWEIFIGIPKNKLNFIEKIMEKEKVIKV